MQETAHISPEMAREGEIVIPPFENTRQAGATQAADAGSLGCVFLPR